LKENSCDYHNTGNDILEGGVLYGNKYNEHEYNEDIGIEAEEVELYLVSNDLHSKVGVDILLVLEVEVDESDEDEDHDYGSMEAEEGGKWPELEECYEFELDGEARVLYPFMEYLLASHWLILVLHSLTPLVPNAVDDVDIGKDHLYYSEGEGLSCYKFKDVSSLVDFDW
jgi:hypothetical protein